MSVNQNLLEVDDNLIQDIEDIFKQETVAGIYIPSEHLKNLLNSWLRLNLGVLGDCQTQFPEHSYFHKRIFKDERLGSTNSIHKCIGWERVWRLK